MEQIKHVTQYTPRACVYACLEMVTFAAMSQREIHSDMRKHGDDTSLRGEMRQLARMGFLGIRQQFNELVCGEIMLVTVPSLNYPGGNHRIVIDTRDEHLIFDPNAGRESVNQGNTYKTMECLRGFSEVTLIEDCRRQW